MEIGNGNDSDAGSKAAAQWQRRRQREQRKSARGRGRGRGRGAPQCTTHSHYLSLGHLHPTKMREGEGAREAERMHGPRPRQQLSPFHPRRYWHFDSVTHIELHSNAFNGFAPGTVHLLIHQCMSTETFKGTIIHTLVTGLVWNQEFPRK